MVKKKPTHFDVNNVIKKHLYRNESHLPTTPKTITYHHFEYWLTF